MLKQIVEVKFLSKENLFSRSESRYGEIKPQGKAGSAEGDENTHLDITFTDKNVEV